MNILKKYQFWTSAIFSTILFAVIYPLSVSVYTGAYYVLVFNAASSVAVGIVIYFTLTKSLSKSNISKLIGLLLITSLPHLIFALLSYGSWVCLGAAIVFVLILFWYRNKVGK